MGALAIAFAIDVLVSTLCIWLATIFSFVKAEFKIIAAIIFVVSMVSLIPVVGWVIGIVLFIYLIMKVSNCSVVDALWVVLFTKLFSFLAIIAAISLFNINVE
jgi:hypothetical protein